MKEEGNFDWQGLLVYRRLEVCELYYFGSLIVDERNVSQLANCGWVNGGIIGSVKTDKGHIVMLDEPVSVAVMLTYLSSYD